MKFYDLDSALQEAINAAEKPVRIKIEIDSGNGFFHCVFEQDILEANFFGLREAAGGNSARGEILLDNPQGIYSITDGAGREVRVSFSIGEGLPFFQRFIFYIDGKGIQDIKGSGRKRAVYFGLRDFSAVLRKTDEAKDWSSPAVFAYSVVCDKTKPEKSLIHCIAKRAGLSVSDIDCCTIPVTLPFIRLRKNIWSELSSLATAYRCHLECAPEKPLVFAHSPYQTEPLATNEYSYIFTGGDIFYLRKADNTDYYRNTVRLKVNMPVVLERQEIWRYEDDPVFYDDLLKPYYPFRSPLTRVIELSQYEASYAIQTITKKKRTVIYADEIDTQEEAENRIEHDGCGFFYSLYDVTTNTDSAIITLRKISNGDLYKASIFGRPIVVDQNRSFYLKDLNEVNKYGTSALNVTGQYFSEYEIDEKPHYEDWVIRELSQRIQKKRELTVKTHKALFNARVGAKVKITLKNEELTGTINAFSFRYKRERAFIASFHITEGGMNE